MQFYGFRMYDAAIERFPGVDPIADQFAFVSPFNYAENSPIGNIDLWGLQKAESNEFQTAQQTIDNNEKSGGQSTHYPNLSRKEFSNQLRTLVSDPESADLTNFMCGSTSCSYTFLNYKPNEFVEAAFDLYDGGSAGISGGDVIVAYTGGNINDKNPHSAFHIFANPLRATHNESGKLGTNKLNGTRPTTLRKMIRTLGLKIESGGFGKPENIMKMSSTSALEGKFSILLENYLVSHGSKYNSNPDSFRERIPNIVGIHYITVTSPMMQSGRNLRFNWWDHRSTHKSSSFNTYNGSVSNFRRGVKGWWIISK